MERINTGHDPDQIDRLLQNEFGVSLYALLKIISIQVECNYHPGKTSYLPARRTIPEAAHLKDLAARIRTEKRHFEKVYREYCRCFEQEKGPIFLEKDPRVTYENPPTLSTLFDRMANHVQFLASMKDRGRSTLEPTKVIFLWTAYIQRSRLGKTKRGMWSRLIELFYWLWEKLESWQPYAVFDPEQIKDFKPDDLQKRFKKTEMTWGAFFSERDDNGFPGPFASKLFNSDSDIIFLGKRGIYFLQNGRWFPSPAGQKEDSAVLDKREVRALQRGNPGYDAPRLIILPDLAVVKEPLE